MEHPEQLINLCIDNRRQLMKNIINRKLFCWWNRFLHRRKVDLLVFYSTASLKSKTTFKLHTSWKQKVHNFNLKSFLVWPQSIESWSDGAGKSFLLTRMTCCFTIQKTDNDVDSFKVLFYLDSNLQVSCSKRLFDLLHCSHFNLLLDAPEELHDKLSARSSSTLVQHTRKKNVFPDLKNKLQRFLFLSSIMQKIRLRRKREGKVKETSKIKEQESSPLTHLDLMLYPPRCAQLFLSTVNIHFAFIIL